jgi:hypothetical protein
LGNIALQKAIACADEPNAQSQTMLLYRTAACNKQQTHLLWLIVFVVGHGIWLMD